jgi:hypothetical protein
MEWAGEEKTEGLGLIGRRGNLPRRCPNTVHRSNSNAEGNSHFPNAASPYDWRLNVLLRQHAEPISERCASEFGQPRVEVFVGREYGGRKMKFNSSDWYKRASEMRSVASETKGLQSKATMLGIAHDYDLLGCQFEYREKCALRDVITTEAFVHSAKEPEGAGP